MISREEAIERLANLLGEQVVALSALSRKIVRKPFEKDIEALDMAIEALSIERPKGRWELIHDDWNVYQCTECKEWWTLECATPQENNMNFCPFCGADMRDGEDE